MEVQREILTRQEEANALRASRSLEPSMKPI
jgi:hypothetical protein